MKEGRWRLSLMFLLMNILVSDGVVQLVLSRCTLYVYLQFCG